MLVFSFLMLLTPLLAQAAIAPKPSTSPTYARRAIYPQPTSLESIRDPELLSAFVKPLHHLDTLEERRSRATKHKIRNDLGHDADLLPVSNAERIVRGLPLKPPTRKSKPTDAINSESENEMESKDEEEKLMDGWIPVRRSLFGEQVGEASK
ncbi:hypothetical protein M231_03947 [Tremella mesenterica]|uniref:Uncharacterized protein n=1 Tax=Tremella mesenterica TaxID=5217 RepID=A0A4Q1BLT9_TREME|nr:hypothetical protein M231_03947 [Tremella mesenterica]